VGLSSTRDDSVDRFRDPEASQYTCLSHSRSLLRIPRTQLVFDRLAGKHDLVQIAIGMAEVQARDARCRTPPPSRASRRAWRRSHL